MSGCAARIDAAGEGVAAALRAVDCMTAEAAGTGFARLFGPQGALMPALTVALTLAIALFAVGLLTGRARLTSAGLSPRFFTIGLVLTFATSWAAYENVVWNLAARGPDAIAGAITGEPGSAAQAFAQRIDALMVALDNANDEAAQQAAAKAQAAQQAAAGQPAATAPVVVASAAPPGVTPGSMVWMGAAVLLLGTVGVLVTAKIILALLLALGPVFVVMALFPATRGLFAGWLRALVLVALTPLLVVLGGGFTLELAVPAVNRLVGPDGIAPQGAMAFFVLACVHACLMLIALKTAGVMVSGWRVFGASGADGRNGRAGEPARIAAPNERPSPVRREGTPVVARSRAIAGMAAVGQASGAGVAVTRAALPATRPAAGGFSPGAAQRGRASGIGSAFRAAPPAMRIR